MFKTLSSNFCRLMSFVNHAGGYLINDPTTPHLSEIMSMPTKGPLNFSVLGMPDKALEPKNSSERRSLNCHAVTGNCLNNLQKHCKSPLTRWSATENLAIFPAAGRDMNAYYDRHSLKFFYHPHAGKNIYFSDSADIITHEIGHAFLDAMRPDFWDVQSLEIWSFHEAFSDIVAMFNLMNYDKAIKSALDQTNGKMEESNVISRIAEEVGKMIRELTGNPSYLPHSLRDPALERFDYVNPSTLPSEAPNNRLAAECHSFGRVFSGAWYEIFVRFFRMHLESSNPLDALKSARDASFSILMNAIPVSPRVDKYYSAIAKSMLVVGKNRNERYGEIISSVFHERKILQKEVFSQQFTTDIRYKVVSSLSRNDKVLKTEKSTLICLKNNKYLELGDLPIASSMSLDSSVKIEVPYDTYYEFDSLGEVVDAFLPNEEEVRKSAALCLLGISDKIGPEKMWAIKGGFLTRQFISAL